MSCKKTVIISFVGAIVAFAWGFISWGLLTWHTPMKFSNENEVANVLAKNSPTVGWYMYPSAVNPNDENACEVQLEKMKQGPYVYALVRAGSEEVNMTKSMIQSFIRGLIACLILVTLVSWTKNFNAGKIFLLCVVVEFLVGLNSVVPMYIWYGAPLKETVNLMLDHIIEGALIAAVIVSMTRKQAAKI